MRAVAEELSHLVRCGGRRPPSLLIEGETGTGKSLLAATLHTLGLRAGHELVSVNCSTLNNERLESELFGHERGAFTGAIAAKSGLFEHAHQGTLFLDEVHELSEVVQPKLLSVLEERTIRRIGATRSKPIDVWVIAATTQRR